jgi:hypothetical protein
MSITTAIRRVVVVGAVAAIGIVGSAGLAGASSTRANLSHWYNSQGGSRELNRLESAMTSISRNARAENLSGLGSSCQSLRNAAEVAMAGSPIPVRSLQRLWNSALNDFAQGGDTCVSGVNNENASQIDQATGDFSSGTALLNQLDSEL